MIDTLPEYQKSQQVQLMSLSLEYVLVVLIKIPNVIDALAFKLYWCNQQSYCYHSVSCLSVCPDSAGTFMFLVGPLKSDRLSARDQTKINCFSFLVTFIFSCRCPLPVVSPSLLPFLFLYVSLGFAVAI